MIEVLQSYSNKNVKSQVDVGSMFTNNIYNANVNKYAT